MTRETKDVRYGAAQNSASNTPSSAWQGIDLREAYGVRALISAPAGQTITGGTAVWWVWDEWSGAWHESAVQVALPTGRRHVALPDEWTLVAWGRAYLECRSVTTSGGGELSVVLLADGRTRK